MSSDAAQVELQTIEGLKPRNPHLTYRIQQVVKYLRRAEVLETYKIDLLLNCQYDSNYNFVYNGEGNAYFNALLRTRYLDGVSMTLLWNA